MNRYRIAILGVFLLIGYLFSVEVLATPLADFDLHWHVVANGGGSVSSAAFEMQHTVGQTITGGAQSDEFLLGSGYWPGIVGVVPSRPETHIYLPVVLSQ